MRDKLLSANSLEDLGGGSEDYWKDFLANHYHDITTHSFGVLADLRTGGLKRDLSIAFGEMNSSKYLKNDFEGNFLFREKIRYLKIYRYLEQKQFGNVWLDGQNASIDEKDALLAGPRWTVLADFHNLYRQESNSLLVTPPDQFPRITGDNAVIFNGNPKDGKGNLVISNDTKLFYNVGDDPKLRHRPEPKNHPLLPILLKLRMGVCPVVKPSGNDKLHTAIMPKVVLWNPYNKPLTLNNIFLEVPLQHNFYSSLHRH